MKFSRDGMLLWLGALATLVTYLISKGTPPTQWTYMEWLQMASFVAAWIIGKLQASPLESNVNLRLQHPNATVMALLLSVGLVFGAGCAKSHLQEIQVTHDSLALAQDLEAQLCWGVAKVTDPVENRSHCTTGVATQIGLTDARHQAINSKLAQAFTIHKSVTAQLAAGATNVDLATLTSLINAIVSDLAALQQTPEVVRLTAAVQNGKVVKP